MTYTIAERPDLLPEVEAGMLEGVARVWCFHCEHVWEPAQLRLVARGGQVYVYCADPSCDGAGPGFDLWNYDEFQATGQAAHWPTEPKAGQHIPLYERQSGSASARSSARRKVGAVKRPQARKRSAPGSGLTGP